MLASAFDEQLLGMLGAPHLRWCSILFASWLGLGATGRQ